MQCLSPAGEYNLRLGIMKELKPDMVATWQDQYVGLPIRSQSVACWLPEDVLLTRQCLNRPQVFEGHPFIVEAGVSLGGKTAQPVCTNVCAAGAPCGVCMCVRVCVCVVVGGGEGVYACVCGC